MCGIVGYLGPLLAAPVLLSELRCLEYRGYDSAGVAVIEGGKLAVLKAAGKLANLESLLEVRRPSANIGIGHTRWATHGIPNDQNAHPHTDCTSELAIVHNGIIENYEELRDELIAKGHTFNSETDTEVVAHLIEEGLKTNSDNMLAAIKGAVSKLRGAYALGIVSQKQPDRILLMRWELSAKSSLTVFSPSTTIILWRSALVKAKPSWPLTAWRFASTPTRSCGWSRARLPRSQSMEPGYINLTGKK
jgi:glutamine---fructose-6-phosphate transaminase (isomerizing)